MQVIYLREAEIELLETTAYYEDKSTGLGGDFLDKVYTTVKLINRMPEAFPAINSYARRALLKIGRASCREREKIRVVAGGARKNKEHRRTKEQRTLTGH